MHIRDQLRFDVAILGTGMSGTILGAILARKGVDVVMIDEKPHPRFTVGESTIPHTSLLLSILAERYGIPEIDHLTYPDRIAKHICTTCGIKRSFGFSYHRQNEPYDHRMGLQFGTSSKDESHLFRQDIDAYLLYVAIKYGATARLDERISSLSIDKIGVTIETDSHATIHAKYVVDATGHKSFLAEKFNLREKPIRLKHHSRTIFTHMIDVRLFEEMDSPLSLPWNQTTHHHVFDGGWFWVIPFNNSKYSTNPLISVGLTVDSQRFPRNNIAPDREFLEFLNLFPSVREQFKDAKPVRPWVSTGRLQYSSTHCTGYRYCLMSHTAGFIDPLFSRGLINTVEIIAALVDPLLGALSADDFSEEPFRNIDCLQKRILSYNDSVVHYSFQSWSDFDLCNAWLRVWALGTIITEFRLIQVLSDYTKTHDLQILKGEASNPVFSDFEDPDYAGFFLRACTLMGQFESGNSTAKETAAQVFSLTKDYEFPVLLTLEGMRRAGWLKDGDEVSDGTLEAARKGYRWALSNPTSRDLFGNVDTFYRWRARQGDPHVQ